jgi:hypothetical protein
MNKNALRKTLQELKETFLASSAKMHFFIDKIPANLTFGEQDIVVVLEIDDG